MTTKTPRECPVHIIDEEALKRAIAKAKELADAELSMLTDTHSFDEMHERLESLRKETV